MRLNWIIPVAMVVGGISLMVYESRFSRKLYYGQDVNLSKYLLSSVLSGLWTFLTFVGVILGLGAMETGYKWTISGILGVVFFGFVVGLIASIGALWQFFVVGKFRELLYQWLKRRRGGREKIK